MKQENTSINNPDEMVSDTISDLNQLITLEREIVEIADEVEDGGTMVLMDELIPTQEKTIWMLSSFLG